MKAIPLMTIWLISFLASLATIESLNLLFWIAFAAFGFTSSYVAKHEERIFRELEEVDKRKRGKNK